MSDLL